VLATYEELHASAQLAPADPPGACRTLRRRQSSNESEMIAYWRACSASRAAAGFGPRARALGSGVRAVSRSRSGIEGKGRGPRGRRSPSGWMTPVCGTGQGQTYAGAHPSSIDESNHADITPANRRCFAPVTSASPAKRPKVNLSPLRAGAGRTCRRSDQLRPEAAPSRRGRRFDLATMPALRAHSRHVSSMSGRREDQAVTAVARPMRWGGLRPGRAWLGSHSRGSRNAIVRRRVR